MSGHCDAVGTASQRVGTQLAPSQRAPYERPGPSAATGVTGV